MKLSRTEFAVSTGRRDSIPLSVKLGFSAWMLFWVTVVLWAYGPKNFLWLCNLAQFLILYAVWRGNALIVSSQAGAVTLVGLVWSLDLMVGLASGGAIVVFTGYMFDPALPLLARMVSLYHLWLPVFTIWLALRLGYDRRGPFLQCLIGAAAILGAWLLTEPERNINLVWDPPVIALNGVPQAAYVALLLVLSPVLIYWPGHVMVTTLLRILFRRSRTDALS